MQLICRMMEVSPSAFYEWVKRPLSDRAVEDQRLLVSISATYTASGGVFGYRCVQLDSREVGEKRGKHRLGRQARSRHAGDRPGSS